VLLVTRPSLGGATFAVLFGAYAALTGAAEIWSEARIKRLRHSVEQIGNPAAAIGKVTP
jgi:hypothetical protein